MRTVLPTLALLCALCGPLRAATLDTHTVVLDGSSNLLSWVTPQNRAYGHVAKLSADFIKAAMVGPIDPANGLPMIYTHSEYDPTTFVGSGWPNHPAGRNSMLADSLTLYYAYSGDSNVLNAVRALLDYQMSTNGTTPTNYFYARVPWSASAASNPRYGTDNISEGVGNIEPDKFGELGDFGYLRFYKITGETKYRDAAIACADALAANVRTGNTTQSPWPYRVNAQTGAVVEEYCAHIIAPIRLFDELIRLGLGNTNAYATARATAWNWLMTYPMTNNFWTKYFEDVGIDGSHNGNLNQYNPGQTVRYFLERPELNPNWQAHSSNLTAWIEANFGGTDQSEPGLQYGARVISEQNAYKFKMASHSGRFAAICALLAEKTGDVALKEKAFRTLNWCSYMARTNGAVIEGPFELIQNGYNWYSDGHGDYIRHFILAMGAFPEWAPADENHLLRSSSVVKFVAYTNTTITYATFDNAATEVFRLASVPTNVLVGGSALPLLTSLTNQGWIYDAATGVLRVRHDTTNQIQVQLDPSTFPLVANVTFNGAQTFQTIDGFGVNMNAGWWNGGEVTPALDLLVDQLGAKIFRAVIEEMDWEAVNDDASPTNFNWTYYNSVYSNARFQGVWNTLHYLNQKGVSNGLVISFMGQPPSWMGPNSTVSGANEDEFVETMASLLYYARNTAGINFNLISPLNETDTGGVEGPNMGAAQFATILHKLAVKLDAIGMGDVRFVAPEAAGNWSSFFNACVADPVIMGKLACWGIHQYGGDAGGYQNTISGTAYPNKPLWVTETATFSTTLSQVKNNPTANLVWDGFDSIYQHAIRAGRGTNPPNDSPGIEPPLIAYNTGTHLYTPRKGFYEHAQLFKFVRPGAQRIGWSGSAPGLSELEAFRNPTNGQFTVVGINTNGAPVTLQGTLAAIAAFPALDFHYTSPTANLVYAGAVSASNGTFSVTIPANSIFTLVSSAGAFTTALTSPTSGATFTSPALITLAAAAFGGSNAVTNVEFYAGATKIGSDTTVPYGLVWPNVPIGNYSLTARASDSAGTTVTSVPVSITVIAPGGSAVLGYTNDGATTDFITDGTGAYINANRYQAQSSATVTQIRAKVGAITGRYQCAIYSDNGGNANTLLRSTVTLTNVATNGWQTFPLTNSLTITNGSYYWLAIWSDDLNARVYADNGGSLRYAAYPFGPWPPTVNLTGSGSFTYSIYATGPGPTAFNQWKANYGLAANTPANADANGDGLPLMIEYSLGLDPLNANTTGFPTPTLTSNFLTLTYTKIKAATDITNVVEAADAPSGPWLSTTNDVEQFWQLLDDLTTQTITARDKAAVSNAPSRFLRLKVSQP